MPFAKQPTFRYLDVRSKGPIGGRGNAVRLYLLANKVPFTDELVSLEKWSNSEKQRVKESGEQPAGHLPVLQVGGKFYAEHAAINRFIGRQEGLYGKDIQLDYETDAVASAAEEWRSSWGSALGQKEGAEEGSDKLEAYEHKRSDLYIMMESYYEQRTAKDGPYLVASDTPGFGDTATFNMIRDDQVMHGKVDLAPYPNLKAMYEACDAVPAVRKWIDDWEAREV